MQKSRPIFLLLLLTTALAWSSSEQESLHSHETAIESTLPKASEDTPASPVEPLSYTSESSESETPPPPYPIDPENFKMTFFKTILMIVFALVIVFVLLWLVKRFSQQRFRSLNGQNYIKILEKLAISPKTMLYVVEVGNEHLILSESQLEVRSLITLEKTSGSKNSDQG